jgi:hypothetical protein
MSLESSPVNKTGTPKHALSIVLLVMLVFLVINILELSGFSIPLGTDGLIKYWPVGESLHNSTNVSDFLKMLTSGVMGEDKFSPVSKILGYVLYAPDRDPVTFIQGFAILTFLLTFLGMALSVYLIWTDWVRVIIFVALVSFNFSLIGDNLIAPLHSPGICIATWSFFLFCHYLKRQKILSFVLSMLLLMTSMVTSESSFLLIPLFITVTLLFDWPNRRKIRLQKKIWIGVITVLMITPYLIFHYQLYGTLLPGTRVGQMQLFDGPATILVGKLFGIMNFSEPLTLKLTYASKMLVMLFSNWFYGLLRAASDASFFEFFVVSTLGAVFVVVVLRRQLYSPAGKAFMIALVLMIGAVIYTWRYGVGIWMFVGLIANIVLADILAVVFLKFSERIHCGSIIRQIYLIPIIFIPPLILINFYVSPYTNTKFEREYKTKGKEELAGYRAINEANSKLLVVRLPDAEPIDYHAIQFWMGNKMFHGQPALVYFEKWHEMLFNNMYVETHYNNEDKPYDYYREALTALSSKDVAVVLQGKDAYTRIFGRGSGNKLFRTSIFDSSSPQKIAILLPDLDQRYKMYSGLEISLSFSGSEPQVVRIAYGDENIEFGKRGGEIIFRVDDYSQPNWLEIIVEPDPGDYSLIIEGNMISYEEHDKEDRREQYSIVLKSETEPWRYVLSSGNVDNGRAGIDWEIVGTVSTGRTEVIEPLIAHLEDTDVFQGKYLSYDRKRKNRKNGELKINVKESREVVFLR